MKRTDRSSKRKSEPPSTRSKSPLFLIGQDARGHWVVQDQRGLCGGLFVGRAEALKFARFESGDRPHAIIMVSGILELSLNADAKLAGDRAPNMSLAYRRVA